MATSTLISHKGARPVALNELALIEAPPPTETWFPVSHFDVYREVHNQLTSAGYEIGKQSFSISHEGHRFFGTLDLKSAILDGITLAVGIRNSTDKTFPIGFCCGNRVFVCDNLAFTSEVVVSKKHTKYGQDRYVEGLSKAVGSLSHYRESQERWIGRLQTAELSPELADAILLRAYERKVITSRLLPQVIREWRNPSFEAFRGRSAWDLWNCFTTILGRTMQATHPARAAATTIRLQGLFSENSDGQQEIGQLQEPGDFAGADAEGSAERWD